MRIVTLSRGFSPDGAKNKDDAGNRIIAVLDSLEEEANGKTITLDWSKLEIETEVNYIEHIGYGDRWADREESRTIVVRVMGTKNE